MSNIAKRNRTNHETSPLLLLALACFACRVESPPSELVADLLPAPPKKIRAETRQILFGHGSRKPLVKGWTPDQWNRELDIRYVWANATDASIRFRLLDPREQQFLVKLAPFPTPEPQRITVLVNGTAVREISPAPGFLEYRFVAPAEVLRRGRNHLTFRHSALGADGRRLAAGYVSILNGPQCLRLRPKGTPPDPPGVRPEEKSLVVRGPAELQYLVALPDAAELFLEVTALDEAARVVVGVRGNRGRRVEAAVRSIAPGWFGRRPARRLSVDLSRWAGESVDLRLGFLPEPCQSPLATVRLTRAEIRSRR